MSLTVLVSVLVVSSLHGACANQYDHSTAVRLHFEAVALQPGLARQCWRCMSAITWLVVGQVHNTAHNQSL